MEAIEKQNWKLQTPPAYFWLALRQVRNFAAVRCEKDYHRCIYRSMDESCYMYSMNVVADYLDKFEDENWEAVLAAREAIKWDLPEEDE
jgi:hypothetical protein